MFKLKKQGIGSRVKGWIARPIIYEIRVPEANWSNYFGKYLNQKWGQYDSDDCWLASAINSAEDQMEWLWKNNYFSQEAKDFFTSNGYIDSDGDISFSERFHEILCGNKDNGGSSPEAWQSFQKRGFIPRSMLTYSVAQANSHQSRGDFVADYFNISAVTPQMILLGQQSLKYINIAYQSIGSLPTKEAIVAALKQAPVNIGIPIPVNVSNWNNTFVQYDGGTVPAHEVELYGIDDKGQYLIFDQYIPVLKTLGTDYLVPLTTQGIIYARDPVIITQPSDSVWSWFFNWINNALTSFQFG